MPAQKLYTGCRVKGCKSRTKHVAFAAIIIHYSVVAQWHFQRELADMNMIVNRIEFKYA